MPAHIDDKGCLCVRSFRASGPGPDAREEAFWGYWKQRWPGATCDEKKLSLSANYKNTREAFIAGFDAGKNKG